MASDLLPLWEYPGQTAGCVDAPIGACDAPSRFESGSSSKLDKSLKGKKRISEVRLKDPPLSEYTSCSLFARLSSFVEVQLCLLWLSLDIIIWVSRFSTFASLKTKLTL